MVWPIFFRTIADNLLQGSSSFEHNSLKKVLRYFHSQKKTHGIISVVVWISFILIKTDDAK